jgi:hypothetical protein
MLSAPHTLLHYTVNCTKKFISLLHFDGFPRVSQGITHPCFNPLNIAPAHRRHGRAISQNAAGMSRGIGATWQTGATRPPDLEVFLMAAAFPRLARALLQIPRAEISPRATWPLH